MSVRTGEPPTARRRTRPTRRAWLLGLVLILGVVGVAGWAASRLFGGAPDYSGTGHGTAVVEVRTGDTATDIGGALEKAGVVRSVDAFVSAARADQRSLGIEPGFYQLRLQMSGTEALALMLDPTSRVQNEVVVPEGLRVDQVVDRLAEATGLPASDFEQVLEHPAPLHLPAYAEGSAEGFLFPATYQFPPDATPEQMLRAMVDRFRQAAADVDLVHRAAATGHSPREVVTIASLVQAEVAEADFGTAARVVENRLAAGMPLQFDSTVNYALRTSDLTLDNDQLAVDSPYNTYRYPGLPPGPINSPGEAALEAALAPPAGDWLYFVAVAPGSDETRFTDSYEQFLQWKSEFYDNVP